MNAPIPKKAAKKRAVKNGPKKAHGMRVKAYRDLVNAEWKMVREHVKLARELRAVRAELKAVRGRLSKLEKRKTVDGKAALLAAIKRLE